MTTDDGAVTTGDAAVTASASAAVTPGLPTRLLNRNFLLLWQGQLVSQLGNQAFFLAMVLWLMEATGSASLMGLIMMVSLLPSVVLGPFGGTLADRYPRVRIIIASDLIRGVAVLGLAAFLFSWPDATASATFVLFGVAVLGGVTNAAFQPAIAAAIPDLLPADKVAAGNSMNQFTVQASTLVGQALGGFLYAVVGAPVLFLVDGVSYLLSAVSESFIRIPATRRDTDSTPGPRTSDDGERTAGYFAETVEGFRYVWDRIGMRAFLLFASGVNFLVMPVIILLPFYATDVIAQDPAWYGYLLAALGGGSIIGYLVAGTPTVAPARRSQMVIMAFAAVAASIIAVSFVRTPVLALILFALVGAFSGTINIFVLTLIQLATPSAIRGRVMAVVITLASAVAPLGMAIGGVLGDATGKNIPLVYLGCGSLIGLLVLAAAAHPALREFLSSETAS